MSTEHQTESNDQMIDSSFVTEFDTLLISLLISPNCDTILDYFKTIVNFLSKKDTSHWKSPFERLTLLLILFAPSIMSEIKHVLIYGPYTLLSKNFSWLKMSF
jgi:hypothetical protein